MDILVCPITKGSLVQVGEELWSKQAGLAFPIKDGIPIMLEHEARTLTEEEIENLKKR
ncbi:MAG: Trm112 family protein [Pseudomonadota bacterium]